MDDSPPISQLTPLLDGLARLDQRLARIEQQIEHLERVAQIEPALSKAAAMAVDSLDHAARALQERGVDLDARMHNALLSVDRLTTSEATAQLAQLLELAQAAPNLFAVLVDTLDQHLGALRDRGIDVEGRLGALGRIVEKVTAPRSLAVAESLLEHLPSFDRLLGSGALGAGPVDVVSRAGQALSAAQQAAVRPLGAIGLLRALSDSDVQHALGFAIAFARAFGRSIAPSHAAQALPTDIR